VELAAVQTRAVPFQANRQGLPVFGAGINFWIIWPRPLRAIWHTRFCSVDFVLWDSPANGDGQVCPMRIINLKGGTKNKTKICQGVSAAVYFGPIDRDHLTNCQAARYRSCERGGSKGSYAWLLASKLLLRCQDLGRSGHADLSEQQTEIAE
jgi:hypothetical protein